MYVGGNPLFYVDPFGLTPNPNGVIPGGPWTEAVGQRPGTFWGPAQSSGPRAMCRYVPDGANGGPPSARQPYWKVQTPGQPGWQRFNLNGQPITAGQAHPGSGPRSGPRGGAVRGIGWMMILSEVIRAIADQREAERSGDCSLCT